MMQELKDKILDALKPSFASDQADCDEAISCLEDARVFKEISGRIADLEAENKRLREVLRCLVEIEPLGFEEESSDRVECVYCDEVNNHEKDCPWVIARQTLKRKV
jgi:hypothetical protein